jgi:hypothetical protein
MGDRRNGHDLRHGSDVAVTLPPGATRLRARLVIGGQTLTSEERRVRVRRAAGALLTAVRAGARVEMSLGACVGNTAIGARPR